MVDDARGLARGQDGFFHPRDTQELCAIVTLARRAGQRVRVRGSAHSVASSIYAYEDRHRTSHGGYDVMLDQMRRVEVEPEPSGDYAKVEVGGGCNLGIDPLDPSGSSTFENSLTHILDLHGFALSGLGGISHQSIAGFLMTGSAGGSLRHGIAQDVLGFEFVDGKGHVHRVRRADPLPFNRRLFCALGVSMGLLGVITKVYLRVGRSYDIAGQEVTTSLADCPVDLFGARDSTRTPLPDFLRNEPYSRILWWTQPGFHRTQIWSCRRVRSLRAERRPFEILSPMQSITGSLLQTLVGNLGQLEEFSARVSEQDWQVVLRSSGSSEKKRRVLETGIHLLGRLFGTRLARQMGKQLEPHTHRYLCRLMQLYVRDETKRFRDSWHYGLPMDNQLDIRLWPTWFSELWVPIERAEEAMRIVRDVLLADGTSSAQYRRSRAFPVEFYASPSSPFWLSPGYDRESFRINPCWFGYGFGDPQVEMYRHFYAALAPLGFRPHWGKFLPDPSKRWKAHYRTVLPKLDEFLELREILDPDQIFVNDYWRAHLGIPMRAHTAGPVSKP